jgi:energy-coupling factor transporter ATP-binding protein EcfA2
MGTAFFDHASVLVPSKAKVGLVGRNGVGKSTLFKLIQGELAPDGGECLLPRGARIASVDQEHPATLVSLLDTIPWRRTSSGRRCTRNSKPPNRDGLPTSMPVWRRSTPTERRPAPAKSWPVSGFQPPNCPVRCPSFRWLAHAGGTGRCAVHRT